MKLNSSLAGEFEVVFVVDGSPDRCLQILRERLPSLPLRTRLLSLSRNFGSFAAIAAGLDSARGSNLAVMAADLQEPPELVLRFFEVLDVGRADIVFGVRGGRSDPWLSEIASNLFWFFYRKLVVRDMPRGRRHVRLHSGGARSPAPASGGRFQPDRPPVPGLAIAASILSTNAGGGSRVRAPGRSARSCATAWTVFSTSRIFPSSCCSVRSPCAAALGSASILVIVAKLRGDIQTPGYTPIVLATLFFGALTSLGFGIVGQDLWLGLQVGRRRPNYIVHSAEDHGAKDL